MAVVLKTASEAGQSYDTLFDAVKSLVTGLGSMLRLTSHGATVENAVSHEESQMKASFITAYKGRLSKNRKGNLKSRTSLSNKLGRRTKRDGADVQLQVGNRTEIQVKNLNRKLKLDMC